LRRVTRGYNDGDTDYGYPWETQWDHRRALWDLIGNGGMLTTLDDVYKWMVAIRDNKIVSQKTKDKMFQAYLPNSSQAFGWNVGVTEGKAYGFREGDAVPQAWNVEFRLYPEDDLIAVVLANKRVRAGSIRRYAMPQLVNIALFGTSPELPRFANINPTKLNRLEGIYKLESGSLFHVKATNAVTGDGVIEPTLTIGGEGQQAIDLIYSGASLPDTEKLSADLNGKTSAYIEALIKNDAAALKAMLPSNASAEEAIRRWNDSVTRQGGLEHFEILGTSALNQQGLQTFIRLKFKNLSDVYKVTWRDRQLWQQGEDAYSRK
jgi:hypothetical protein